MLRALQTRQELLQCRERLRARNLDFTDERRLRIWALVFRLRYRHAMPVPDVLKSWDVWHALVAIQDSGVTQNDPVLDMGCYNSEILYVLNYLRYRHLYGCDLNPLCRRLPFWHRIKYSAADITRTPYPDNSFAAITCLSVIEHGVPLRPLAREVARLLKPGGVFVMTTDYDGTGERHVVPRDLKPFGLDWQVYSPEGFRQILAEFQEAGLAPIEPEATVPNQTERPITWNGHTYTFALAVLRARSQ